MGYPLVVEAISRALSAGSRVTGLASRGLLISTTVISIDALDSTTQYGPKSRHPIHLSICHASQHVKVTSEHAVDGFFALLEITRFNGLI